MSPSFPWTTKYYFVNSIRWYRLSHSVYKTWRYRHCWSWQYAGRASYKNLVMGLVYHPVFMAQPVEHQSVESESLRFDYLYRIKFFSLPHAHHKHLSVKINLSTLHVDILNDLSVNLCYLTVDPCCTDPCENDGQCFVDDNYDFFCVCPIPKAYEGKNCSKPGKRWIVFFYDLFNPLEFSPSISCFA